MTQSMKRLAKPAEPGSIQLYGGSTSDTQTEIWQEVVTEAADLETWVRNVTDPTLTPFLPARTKANGAAVLVIPGGGWQFVSISNEGWPIAQSLANLGVAAFVLKYRVQDTPDNEAAFEAALAERFDELINHSSPTPEMLTGMELVRADARMALQRIRKNAAQWGIDPTRVGILGFSAGAMSTLADAPDAMPNFIAAIYGSMSSVTPPPNPPPMFAALSSDDPLFGKQGFGLIESWQKAGGSVECHIYSGGGHGFGLQRKGTTSDLWFDQYIAWMKAEGFLETS